MGESGEKVDETGMMESGNLNTNEPGQNAVINMMQDPQMLAGLQQQLSSMVGMQSGYAQSLPAPVKRRIKALKKLLNEHLQMEADFHREVHELEVKYADKYKSLWHKRQEITCGTIEPTDDECDWPSDVEEEDEAVADAKDEEEKKESSKEEKKMADQAKLDENPSDKDVTGIPEFWLTIFKSVEMLSELIQDHDEPVLRHLDDLRVSYGQEQMTFTLHFIFSENEYFTNKELTKLYRLNNEPNQSDPFSYEGPEIVECKGCDIQWKANKDTTIKLLKKKLKKQKGPGVTVTRQEKRDSFFNFFKPPKAREDGEDDDEESEELAGDYEIGQFLRDRVIPRAVLFFTGEENEEYDDEDDEEEEGDDDDEDEDENNDEDYDPNQKNGQQECKQQ